MAYWQKRTKYRYYELVRDWLAQLGPLDSIADIGCCDTPVATWGDFDCRYSVDQRERPALPGVQQIIGSWPCCATLLPVCDVVTCLQTLEHIADPEPFCEALFAAARVAVILSVPYRWKHGLCLAHVQDPVDEEKLLSWTHREPTRRVVVNDGGLERMVCLYATGASSMKENTDSKEMNHADPN